MKIFIVALLCIFIMQARAQTTFRQVINIDSLEAVSDTSTKIVVVTDPTQGGLFNYVASGLEANDCCVFPASGIGTGFWQRQRTQSGVWLSDWWGIKPNDTTNQSDLMQNAINYIAGQGGGTLQLRSGGRYVASDTIKDNVHIVGGAYWGLVFDHGVSSTQYDVSWVCPSSKFWCITTPSQPDDDSLVAVSAASISGISFHGNGLADTLSGGINLVSWRRGAITSCSFYNFAEQAVLQNKPSPGKKNGAITFRDIFVNNCCLDTAVGSPGYKAAFDLQGDDDVLDNVQLSCLPADTVNQLVIPTGRGNIYDLYLNGGDADVINSVFQLADVGVYLDSLAEKVQFTNNKTDNTSRQGIVISSGFDNQFFNTVVNRPSQEHSNTYDAVDLLGDLHDNKIIGLQIVQGAPLQGGTPDSIPKYCVAELSTDTLGNANRKNEIAFVTAQTTAYGTALYYSLDPRLSYFYGNENVQVDTTATPNVSGYNLIEISSGTSPITNFMEGTPSQLIYVWFEVSKTVDNNGNISLASGSNFTYPANSVVGFRNILVSCQSQIVG